MEKRLISVSEASEKYSLTKSKIREIAKKDIDYNLHLMVGRVIKIKVAPFDEYIIKAAEL